MNKRYKYRGPQSAVTLNTGEEVILRDGAEVTLPSGNPYVISLVAQGHLEAVDVKPANKTQAKEQE